MRAVAWSVWLTASRTPILSFTAYRRPSPHMAEMRLKSAREIAAMQQAGQIVADTLVLLKARARAGMTTRELNQLAAAYLDSRGAVTAYTTVGFDGVVCTSLNEQVVHGVPGRRILRAGDVLKVDIAAAYKGYLGDAAITFGIGMISPLAQRLIAVT